MIVSSNQLEKVKGSDNQGCYIIVYIMHGTELNCSYHNVLPYQCLLEQVHLQGFQSLQPSDVSWMSFLFAEDQKRGVSDTSVVFFCLPVMPVDKLHNVTGFPGL